MRTVSDDHSSTKINKKGENLFFFLNVYLQKLEFIKFVIQDRFNNVEGWRLLATPSYNIIFGSTWVLARTFCFFVIGGRFGNKEGKKQLGSGGRVD